MVEIIGGIIALYLVVIVGKFLNFQCYRCGKKFWTWNLLRNHCSSCKKITEAQESVADDYLESKKNKKNDEKFTCVKCEVIYKEEYLGGETKDGKVCRYCLEKKHKE